MKHVSTQKSLFAAPRDRYTRGQRHVAWFTLFCFFVSPATVSFADSTDTAIGNADTGDGSLSTASSTPPAMRVSRK